MKDDFPIKTVISVKQKSEVVIIYPDIINIIHATTHNPTNQQKTSSKSTIKQLSIQHDFWGYTIHTFPTPRNKKQGLSMAPLPAVEMP